MRHLVQTVLVHAQRATASRDEAGPGDRVATGKERYFVSLPNQFLGQIRYHPLRPAIQLGRHTLKKRRYLRNSHNKPGRTLRKFFGLSKQVKSKHANPALRFASDRGGLGLLVFNIRVTQAKRVHPLPDQAEGVSSRATSRGFLSSRKPRKTGARNFHRASIDPLASRGAHSPRRT